MKKKKLNRLMLTGIASGVLLAQSIQAAEKDTKNSSSSTDTKNSSPSIMDLVQENNGNIAHHLMTEDELLVQLNEEGTKLYNSLSPEGKKLAIQTASSSCNGENPCANLNACATTKNKCAGQGSCKGQGKCAISDPNLAVKLVAKKLEKQRLDAQNNK